MRRVVLGDPERAERRQLDNELAARDRARVVCRRYALITPDKLDANTAAKQEAFRSAIEAAPFNALAFNGLYYHKGGDRAEAYFLYFSPLYEFGHYPFLSDDCSHSEPHRNDVTGRCGSAPEL